MINQNLPSRPSRKVIFSMSIVHKHVTTMGHLFLPWPRGEGRYLFLPNYSTMMAPNGPRQSNCDTVTPIVHYYFGTKRRHKDNGPFGQVMYKIRDRRPVSLLFVLVRLVPSWLPSPDNASLNFAFSLYLFLNQHLSEHLVLSISYNGFFYYTILIRGFNTRYRHFWSWNLWHLSRYSSRWGFFGASRNLVYNSVSFSFSIFHLRALLLKLLY